MSLPSDQSIRAAIKASVVLGAPKAIVIPRWTLGFQDGQWPGLLKSPNDSNRTHGYVITRNNNDAEEKSLRRIQRRWTYSIFGLHYYETGNDTANSEDLFTAEIDAIVASFDLISQIAGANIDEPISFRQDLRPYGGELCHVALGSLILKPC